MLNIKYIDNNYFHKICLNSESIIIFRKPLGLSDELCNEISESIEKLVEKDNTSMSLSVVHWGIKDFEFSETIEKNLFVCKGNGNIPFSYGLYPYYKGNTIDLLDSEDKIIATVSIREKKKKWWWLGTYLLLAILIVVHYANSKMEKNRIETNEMLYNKDLARIDSLKSYYNTAIEDNNAYAAYLPTNKSQAIGHYLTHLIGAADSMLESVQEKGEYLPIFINADSIRTEIREMVRGAEDNKYRTEEKRRKEGNVKAYNENISIVNKILEYLQTQKNRNKDYVSYLNSKSLNEIETKLSELKQLMETHLSEARNQGAYVEVHVDYDSIISSIDNEFKRAKEIYTEDQKREKQKREAERKRELKQRNKTGKISRAKTSTQAKGESAFSTLVRKADKDYKKYFYNKKDIAAAHRAISNYQKALNIMYQSSVDNRMKILQNELR